MSNEMIKTEFTLWPWIQPRLQPSPIAEFLQDPDDSCIEDIEKNSQKLRTLIKERPFLMAQYRIQVAHLLSLIKEFEPFHPKLKQEINKTLRMSRLLQKIYVHIEESDDEARMDIDVKILETVLLKFQNPQNITVTKLPEGKLGFGQQLRSLHQNTNLSRLAAIRTRRLVLTCVALEKFLDYRAFVAKIEVFTNPFFLYLSWAFFLPRLLLNVSMVMKKWLQSNKKNDLPWYIRIEAYLNLRRRLYELWSDSVWFISGILLCFVLFGPFAPWRPLTTVLVQVSDTVMMTTRSFFELRRLMVLKNEYLTHIQNNPNEKNATYLKALEERMAFEKKVSYLVITNNVLMTIAFMTVLPSIIVLHPFLPLLGAVLGVLTTIRFYLYSAANDALQPRVNLNLLLKHYEPNVVIPPPAANTVVSRLAVPGFLLLIPLTWAACAANPIFGSILCLTLLLICNQKMQSNSTFKKQLEQTMQHHFFKPVVEKPTQNQTIGNERAPLKLQG